MRRKKKDSGLTGVLSGTGFQTSSLASEWVGEVAGEQRRFAALVPEQHEEQGEGALPAKGPQWQHGGASAQVQLPGVAAEGK